MALQSTYFLRDRNSILKEFENQKDNSLPDNILIKENDYFRHLGKITCIYIAKHFVYLLYKLFKIRKKCNEKMLNVSLLGKYD